MLALPAVANAINGAEEELSNREARVLLTHVPDLEIAPTMLQERNVAGVVLVGSSVGEAIGACRSPFLEWLRTLPSVWLLCRPAGCWGVAVGANDTLLGQYAADYLVARGHRRLAFLNPKPDHAIFLRREDGFVSRARRLGAEVVSYCEAPSRGWPLPDSPALTTEAVDPLVEKLLAAKPRPTAVFPAADSLAAATYRALTSRGLTVGKDISVISGNNDAALTAGLYPHLTTFDIHANQIGRLGVAQLAHRLAQPDCSFNTELLVEPTLVEGESVARLSR